MAPNSSSACLVSAGSNCSTMPATASSVSTRVASSTCPEGATTYGFSPTWITRASPSSPTMAWSREGTRLIYRSSCRREPSCALGARSGTCLVKSHQFDQFVAARLVRRDHPLGSEILQHRVVGVVGSADLRKGREHRIEHRHRHRLDGHRPRTRQKAEAADRLGALRGDERHVDLVADEVVVGFGSARGRILDADERDVLDRLQPIDHRLGEGAFTAPLRRINSVDREHLADGSNIPPGNVDNISHAPDEYRRELPES